MSDTAVPTFAELNAKRIERARQIVDTFGESGEDFVTAAQDIITDILHAVDKEERSRFFLSMDDFLSMAYDNFLAEVDE